MLFPRKFLKKLSLSHFIITLTIGLTAALLLLINTKNTHAQIPAPYKKCDQTADPEFHSLRPYQASPCNTNMEELSRLCGKQMYVRDDIVTSPDEAESCKIKGNSATCNFNLDRKFYISINPFDSELPIMGNTQDVINSQSQNETIDDISKVNEYVSWYLNGVTGRAEYPPLNLDDTEDIKKIVDLTGPLKKLLPWGIQTKQRIETIKEAKDERHDQVIGCVNRITGKNVECYPGNVLTKEIRLTDWNGKLPPLPEDFDTTTEWVVNYRRWRGDSCLYLKEILSFFGIGGLDLFICGQNIFKPDYFANLFTYIPFSSTEDREGKLTAHDVVWQEPSEIVVTDLKTTWRDKPKDARNQNTQNNESVMYFSHMEENVELVNILQSTYLAKGTEVNQKDGPTEVKDAGEACQILNVRHNEGDQLFGELIIADVTYKAKFECEFPVKFNFLKGVYEPYGTCEKQSFFKSKIDTDTPKVDELWTKTVAGNASVFKRIFPKISEGTPVKVIQDIPGVSDVTYETDINLLTANPEIYFPHLGGIYEYFLKAVQTALRPKGMGNPIPSGDTASGVNLGGPLSCERPSTPPDAVGAPKCNFGVGYCSPTNLRKYFSTDKAAKQASIICNAESGGDPSVINCSCSTGSTLDYSIGLFQINMLYHCTDGFAKTDSPITCSIINEDIARQCTNTYFDPVANIEYAVSLSGDGANWNPWSAYKLSYPKGCKEQVDAVR